MMRKRHKKLFCSMVFTKKDLMTDCEMPSSLSKGDVAFYKAHVEAGSPSLAPVLSLYAVLFLCFHRRPYHHRYHHHYCCPQQLPQHCHIRTQDGRNHSDQRLDRRYLARLEMLLFRWYPLVTVLPRRSLLGVIVDDCFLSLPTLKCI